MDLKISERISELIRTSEINRYQLSKKLGISNSALINWENGSREPKVKYLCKLADFFDVSVDYIIGRTDL